MNGIPALRFSRMKPWVTTPLFCLLDRGGFVSGVGMLDHLAGTQLPPETAASICPEVAQNCIFPAC
jgi:hypothetical protein